MPGIRPRRRFTIPANGGLGSKSRPLTSAEAACRVIRELVFVARSSAGAGTCGTAKRADQAERGMETGCAVRSPSSLPVVLLAKCSDMQAGHLTAT